MRNMDKKYCDICKAEISEYDKVYSFSYGEKTFNPLNRSVKKGEICNVCIKQIDAKVQSMKK